MFRRKREAAPAQMQEMPIEQDITPEVQAPVEPEVVESLGNAALSDADSAPKGFESNESGILVPDGSARIEMNGDTLVTDSRRLTLESIEANFQAEQERLNSPLEKPELDKALDVLEEQARQRLESYEGNDRIYENDTKRDIGVIRRLRRVMNGEKDIYIADARGDQEDVSVSQRLASVVAKYAKLVPENYGPDSMIGSMGGTVRIPEDGIIHSEGYNGSILYDFARAKQIAEKLETMPKEVRETLLEASGDVDASWLYNEPVIVDPSLTKFEQEVAA